MRRLTATPLSVITQMQNTVVIVGKRNHLQWVHHMADGFAELGLDVLRFETNVRSPIASLHRGMNKLWGATKDVLDEAGAAKLYRLLLHRKPHLVVIVGCFFVSLPYYKAISSLKAKPIVMGWDGDNHAILVPSTREYSEHIDVLFSSDESAIEKINSVFRHVEYLPFAANPRVHRPLGGTRNLHLYFCGQRTQEREKILIQGLSNFSLTLCGKRWRRINSPRPWKVIGRNRTQQDMVKDLNRHVAGINLHQAAHDSLFPVNMRTFEVPACETLLICDKREALPNLFDVGKEILVFADARELADIARFSLVSPFAQHIAEQGRKRILSEHTYAHRAIRILDVARML